MVSVSNCQITNMQGMSGNTDQDVIMDRFIRAPFNGMRGKKDDTDEKMVYRQLLMKRAPFNGMRGKRAPFNGMRGKRAPFNGMRGKRAPFNGMREKRAPFNGMRGKRGGEEEVEYMGDTKGLKVSEVSFEQPI